ncbi:hypothetical protein GCM10023114_53180 [Mycolicibacterium sediminis]|uniref:PknH-like extracellular domain-containing protein n=1 Tax=Mycolicibacterium sediminis TaxID=1286180 RepID=A0A7I7QKQ7_9MYCO|nr:hypothetical protein MSEDJ_10240 [Mycolicibacterium sediminis]
MVALVVCLVLAGCTRVIDDARPRADVPVGPIPVTQVDDLVSPEGKTRTDSDGNLFVAVDPERCAGLSREVEPPFIVAGRPAAQSGAVWDAPEEVGGAGIVELLGVYPTTFDAAAAIATVRRTIDSCRGTVLSVRGTDGSHFDFDVLPPVDSGSADIVLWSVNDPSGWACDNAFTAAYNAAIEITSCNVTNGFDVLAMAKAARERIEALANTTA